MSLKNFIDVLFVRDYFKDFIRQLQRIVQVKNRGIDLGGINIYRVFEGLGVNEFIQGECLKLEKS